MGRAKVCPEHGCPALVPCPVHKRESWAGSQRRRRMGGTSGWQQQRDARTVMDRDRGVCHVCHRPGADRVDHVVAVADGGLDTLANKAPVHNEPCHRVKTQAEARRHR